MDFLENILTVKGRRDGLKRKLKSFGCEVKTCNGHKVEKIIYFIDKWLNHKREFLKPQILIADTIKGYGLKCMENAPKFHFRLPTCDELKMGNRYE